MNSLHARYSFIRVGWMLSFLDEKVCSSAHFTLHDVARKLLDPTITESAWRSCNSTELSAQRCTAGATEQCDLALRINRESTAKDPVWLKVLIEGASAQVECPVFWVKGLRASKAESLPYPPPLVNWNSSLNTLNTD